ncbi:hypothetical protein EJ07DRAFT_185346 [Lizonia empirigonia]|nr:hypothetical protein EJ07DRAFT_185346 [Lizonia empirigonia]
MTMRLATSRPLAAAARSTAARAFSTTALRAKEIAGENTQTPNMRYAPRNPTETLKRAIVNPMDAYKAKGEALHTYGNYLMSCLPKYIQQFSNHTAAEYTQISDITAVDYPTKDQRFEVVYNMLSIRHNSRLRVKTYADEATPVPSLCDLYDGANWYEREVYDLFGVFFVGHPDLRRIMTDYGFDGHPLRKDFPMTGYTEIRYDEEKKRIVVEPLEMTQAFRNFRGGSAAWEQVGPGQDTTPENFKLPTPKPEPPKEGEQKK